MNTKLLNSIRSPWRALPTIGFWALLVATCLMAMELVTRVEERVVFGAPLLSPYRDVSELRMRDEHGFRGRPSAHFRKWQTNRLGFRGPEITRDKPAGTYRVVTAGASETFGVFESPGHEFPRQLEDSLNAFRIACGGSAVRRFEVVNAALPGMSLPTIEQALRLQFGPLRPDVVVLYPTPVQYLGNSRPTPPLLGRYAAENEELLSLWRLRSLERVRDQLNAIPPRSVRDYLVRKRIEALVRQHPPGWRFSSIPVERLSAYESDLRVFIATVHRLGSRPLLLVHANAFGAGPPYDSRLLGRWQLFYPRAEGPIIVAFDSAAAVLTRTVALDSGVPWVDFRRALSQQPRAWFGDATHFTDAGAAVVAGVLAREIESLGAIKDCSGGRPM
jgi:hypothetical protein